MKNNKKKKKKKTITGEKKKSGGGGGGRAPPPPIITSLFSSLTVAGTVLPASGNRAPGAGVDDCKSESNDPAPAATPPRWRNRRDKSTRTSTSATAAR